MSMCNPSASNLRRVAHATCQLCIDVCFSSIVWFSAEEWLAVKEKVQEPTVVKAAASPAMPSTVGTKRKDTMAPCSKSDIPSNL
eukprot:2440401-Amphidinium_carterae.1